MGPRESADSNPEYWKQYTNFQRVKHELIRQYLGGWFPILGSWSGRVLYLDTHAGRGAHAAGQLGSPLIALQTLRQHSHRDRLLRRCEFRFIFIERNESNKAALDREVANLGILPPGIQVESRCGDCFEALESMVGNLRESQSRMAPAFVFVDPYGFRVPGALLAQLMRAGRVELFVNVIWRELDMEIRQGRAGQAGAAALLDQVFAGQEWRHRIASDDFDERADQCVEVIAEKVGAKWATPLRMLAENRKTRYLLLHLTNHDAGRRLMKDCMWSVCPAADGGFYAGKSNQQLLIEPEPDLGPLREWVLAQMDAGPVRWQALHVRVLPEIWRETHVNDVVRNLRNEKIVEARDYQGTCTPKNNPLLVRRGNS
jgi:three-Cys-motif partner protein